MSPPPSGRPGETSPVASADRRDSDRRDMARRNDAKGDGDPMEDGVRAAVPRDRDEYMLMRCSRAPGDRGDTPSSAERKRVSTESRCCTFRLRKDGQVMWNFDLRVVMRPGVLGDTASGRVNRVWRTCCNCAVIFGGAPWKGAASHTRSFTFNVQSAGGSGESWGGSVLCLKRAVHV